jgi:hypothetical protein
MLPIAQHRAPLIAGEGVHVDGHGHLLALRLHRRGWRDPVAAPVPVGADELQRRQHRPIRAGRLQDDRVDEGEQHRPVRVVEPFHQRQVVVAVVGRHRLVRGGQLLKSAGVIQGLEHQPPGPFRHLDVRARARNFSHVLGGAGTSIPAGVGAGGHGRLAGCGQHGAEHPQQPLGLGPMLLARR